MPDSPSVAASNGRWRAAFVSIFVLVQAIKLVIACTLAPFVDEAFYWQESRHLAWGYSDLPPLTAWLIRGGESIAGHGVLGMRWPFLLLGALLPWVLLLLARRLYGARVGWQAGLLCLALPLAGSLGVLALPDVPLTLAIVAALYALLCAMRENRSWQWLALGVALALAWLTHYRAAMIMLAGLLLLVLTPRGRAQWRRPGLWLALGVAALGLVPLLVSNIHQGGAGIDFQLLQRNPWQFHADALVQPLEQALACTPLLYGLILWALWRCLRSAREGRPWDVLAVVAATFVFGYFLFGLFADDTHFRVHWPLQGYLPLLVALPVLLRGWWQTRWRRWLLIATFALAALAQLSMYAYLGAAASRRGLNALVSLKAFPKNFVGWRHSATATRHWLAGAAPGSVLVTDNFKLGAELDFQLDGKRPVYVLDSPLNAEHGRAEQLSVWGLDGHALRRSHAGASVLLAVDETALRTHQQPAWLGSVCSRVTDLRYLGRMDLYAGERRFAFYSARVPAKMLPPQSRDACVVWRQAYRVRSQPQQ